MFRVFHPRTPTLGTCLFSVAYNCIIKQQSISHANLLIKCILIKLFKSLFFTTIDIFIRHALRYLGIFIQHDDGVLRSTPPTQHHLGWGSWGGVRFVYDMWNNLHNSTTLTKKRIIVKWDDILLVKEKSCLVVFITCK